MKRMTNKSKLRHAKASIAKHRKSLNRAKLRKEIAKITTQLRSGNKSATNIRSIASYTNEVSQYFGSNVKKALERLSGYTRIFK